MTLNPVIHRLLLVECAFNVAMRHGDRIAATSLLIDAGNLALLGLVCDPKISPEAQNIVGRMRQRESRERYTVN